MNRRLPALLTALALAGSLGTFSTRAASSPSLAWEEGDGRGEIFLALEDLDGSGVYAAQLELTLDGSWPEADFIPANRDLYSVCQAADGGDSTRLTVCLTSRNSPLGSQERLFLGTLDLGGRGSGEDVLPASADLTLLGRGLNRIEDLSGRTDLRERSGVTGWGEDAPDEEEDGERYRINIPRTEGGTVRAGASRAEEGERITLTVSADGGWELGSLEVFDRKDRSVELRERSEGTYTFRMPASDVEVEAGFVRTEESPPPAPDVPGNLPFADVRESDWYRSAVAYVYEQGLMNGITADRFGPDEPTTRGMIVTIFHRLEGSPEAPAPAFPDVRADFYYAQPIAWAEANGIVTGYEDGTFGPEDNITREQLAAILYRFARYKGWDTGAGVSLDRFPDAARISPYAVQPIAWAVGEGLISGMANGTMSPGGTATRAEAATILMRLEALARRME